MVRFSTALFSGIAVAAGAQAATLEIEFPDAETVETTSVTYRCPQDEIAATYYDVGNNHLAAVTIGDQTIIMANVIAASGAKYAGGQYVWWTKGDEGMLENLMAGEDAAPISCKVAE